MSLNREDFGNGKKYYWIPISAETLMMLPVC